MKMSTFKAYVDVDEYDLADGAAFDDDYLFHPKTELKLLPGEVLVSSAPSVLKFTALSEQRQGILGEMFVTNFKLSFIAANEMSLDLVDSSPPNNMLGECEICLANIESAHHVSESGRKKRLVPGTNMSGDKVHILELHCKDFRILTFSFKVSPVSQGKGTVNAILQYAFPQRSQLLFAFEYKGHVNKGTKVAGTRLYTVASDWEAELHRLKCGSHWRETHKNEHFLMCKSLPETFVVPSNLKDVRLELAANHFHGNRVPVWCWSNADGCGLVRTAGIHPGITESRELPDMLECIRLAHPQKREPYLVDLDSLLPSVRDIKTSYLKLRSLCMPESASQFWEQDVRFYSNLDASKWLLTVANFLGVAKELAVYIYQYRSVAVLQELEGRDLSCIISSLIQIILDPHFRTITGFQSLIQKEWVAMGHPFCDRLGFLRNSENEQCPIFLVFLDCMSQIIQQFPTVFEFSETYLTMLWDNAHLTTFDTFLFNCGWDRQKAIIDPKTFLQPRSIWDWSQLYSQDEITLFYNPHNLVTQCSTEIQKNFILRPQSAGVPVSSKPSLRHRSNSIKGTTSSDDIEKDNRTANNTLYRPVSSASLSRAAVDEQLRPNTSAAERGTLMRQTSLVSMAPAPAQTKRTISQQSVWRTYRSLPVNTHLPILQFWNQCYLRWIPLVNLCGGGSPALYLRRCHFVEEVLSLMKQIRKLKDGVPVNVASNGEGFTFLSACRRTRIHCDVTSSFPFHPGGSAIVHGMPSSIRQTTYMPSDTELELDDSISISNLD